MIQFFDTLRQIMHCDSEWAPRGICRHVGWQVRKAFHGFPCEMTVGGSRLHVDRPLAVAALINSMGEYDYNNMRLLRLVLSHSKSTFIDVGANIGVYTLIASEVPGTTVVTIEPHPTTFGMLVHNIRLNGCRNVICLNVALSSQDGEIRFTDDPGSSVNRILEAGHSFVAELRVPSWRLSVLCRELNVVPDFVKIDVEGHEAAVLEGFADLAGIPKIIFIEGGEGPKVRSWMRAAGYTGPWFSHFKRRALLPARQRRPEDPVFVHKDFLPVLRRMNFDVV
jgi:FkbM family methyltransferase